MSKDESKSTVDLAAQPMALDGMSPADLEDCVRKARSWAERMADLANDSTTPRRKLPWETGFTEEQWRNARSWKDDERVKVLGDRISIEVRSWSPSPKAAIRELEKNPDNAPPDHLVLRRTVSLQDVLALGEYPCETEMEHRAALTCILSAPSGKADERMDYDTIMRIAWQEWPLVEAAVTDSLKGKA